MGEWSGFRGHEAQQQRFRATLANGRLASTYLFVGPAGIGKRSFAQRLAKSLLCEQAEPNEVHYCGTCSACRHVDSDTHPDLILLSKPAEKSTLPLELLVGEPGQRMREGLCHAISLSPSSGRRKIAIIDDADFLNLEGANALLKTLEEPPAHSLIILIGTSLQRQLPTIRSRCQIIRFQPLSTGDVQELLLHLQATDSTEVATAAAALSGGSIATAVEWLAEDRQQMRREWLRMLGNLQIDDAKANSFVQSVISEAGKDNWRKRQALVIVSEIAAAFFRAWLRSACGAQESADTELQTAVRAASAQRLISPETAAYCLEQTLDVQSQLRANAHLPTLVDCWLQDLAEALRGNRGAEQALGLLAN